MISIIQHSRQVAIGRVPRQACRACARPWCAHGYTTSDWVWSTGPITSSLANYTPIMWLADTMWSIDASKSNLARTTPDAPPLKKVHRLSSIFEFKEHCLYCGEICDLIKDPNYPERWRYAYNYNIMSLHSFRARQHTSTSYRNVKPVVMGGQMRYDAV